MLFSSCGSHVHQLKTLPQTLPGKKGPQTPICCWLECPERQDSHPLLSQRVQTAFWQNTDASPSQFSEMRFPNLSP